MKAFLPSWQPGGIPVDLAASVPTAADEEPVPSDGFRATALLDVRGLQIVGSTRTDAPVLATGISLSVARGEIIGLVGVAGSGTREIALAIAGRLPGPAVIAAGSILIDGQEVVGASRRALHRLRETKISLVPLGAPSGLSSFTTVGGRLARTLRRKEDLSQLDPAALLQLTIADAVSSRPDILILDEPARRLDAAGETAALELCHRFRQEFGLSVIVVSRDLGRVAATCDRVAVVEAGRVVEHGSAAETVAAPQHPYTRSLLEAARTARL